MKIEDAQAALALFDEICDKPAVERQAILDERRGSTPHVVAEVERLVAVDQAEDNAVDLSPGYGVDALAAGLWPDAVEQGSTVGRYRIVREIGRGGMGVVFEAEQADPVRRVAIKVMRDGFASAELRLRFRREAAVLGRLQHPGIAHVYEAGPASDDAGPPFIAMELIEGKPLDIHAKDSQLSTHQRLELVARACEAVHHAHQRGILHRDIKPANVLVTTHESIGTSTGSSSAGFDLIGQPKLVDFGVAGLDGIDEDHITRQTRTGQLLGTLSYMSPEQISGNADAVDTRSDVYSLGVILYELLAGRRPREPVLGLQTSGTTSLGLEEPPRLGSIDRALRGDIETIAAKAIEVDPERRYASASEFAEDIRRYLRDEAIQARPTTMMYQVRKLTKRHRVAVVGAIATIVALIAGLVSTASYSVVATRRGAEAQQARIASDAAAYRAGIAAASAALREQDVVGARRFLETTPPVVRGWEYRHIEASLDQSSASAPFTDEETGIQPRFSLTHIHGMAWSSDGLLHVHRRVRAGGYVASYDLESLEIVRRWSLLDRPMAHLVDGSLVTMSKDRVTLKAWDPASGEERGPQHTLSHPIPAMNRQTNSVAPSLASLDFLADPRFNDRPRAGAWSAFHFSPSGRWVALADGQWLEIMSRDESERYDLGSIAEGVAGLAFSPDERYMAVVSFQRRVILYDLAASGAVVWQRDEAHTDGPLCVAFSPDGDKIVSAGQDRLLRLWDAANGESLGTLRGHIGTVFAVHWASNGMIYSADDTHVRMWEPEVVSDPTILRGHGSSVALLDSTDDGLLVSVSATDVMLWDSRSGTAIATLSDRTGAFEPRGVGIAPNQLEFIVTLVHGKEQKTRIERRSLRTGELLNSAEYDGLAQNRKSVYTSDGRYVVERFQRGSVSSRRGAVIDAETLTRTGDFQGRARVLRHPVNGRIIGKDKGVLSYVDRQPSGDWDFTDRLIAIDEIGDAIAFENRGQSVLVSDGKAGLTRFDLRTGQPVRSYVGHTLRIDSIASFPSGDRFVTGGRDGVVRVWDPDSSTPLAELRGHVDRVRGVTVLPDGQSIFSASEDRTIRRWGTATSGELVAERRLYDRARRVLRPRVDAMLDAGRTPPEVLLEFEAGGSLTDRERQIARQCLMAAVIGREAAGG